MGGSGEVAREQRGTDMGCRGRSGVWVGYS